MPVSPTNRQKRGAKKTCDIINARFQGQSTGFCYKNYVKGVADLNGTGRNGGLYEYMNGKSGVLIYAIYKNDPELFLKYAKKGIAQINQHMDQDGYIFSNSWRGVRSLWYHSLGVDAVFGFGELLETQGIVFFDRPLLKDKLRKSYFEALKGLDDPYLFEAKGYRGYNYTKVERKARRYLHKSASALQWIGAWRYPDVGKIFLPAGFDTVVGMNPKYMYATGGHNWSNVSGKKQE